MVFGEITIHRNLDSIMGKKMEVEQRSFEFGPTKGFIVSFLLTKICLENANRIEYLIKGPKGLNFVPLLARQDTLLTDFGPPQVIVPHFQVNLGKQKHF